jgi:hypothetical protein
MLKVYGIPSGLWMWRDKSVFPTRPTFNMRVSISTDEVDWKELCIVLGKYALIFQVKGVTTSQDHEACISMAAALDFRVSYERDDVVVFRRNSN